MIASYLKQRKSLIQVLPAFNHFGDLHPIWNAVPSVKSDYVVLVNRMPIYIGNAKEAQAMLDDITNFNTHINFVRE